MAVRADDVAFGHLVDDRLPVADANSAGDGELLVAQMVEFQNDRIGFAAIDARMIAEELQEVRRAFRHDSRGSALRIVEVAVLVGGVVLSLVRGAAGTAVVVALAALDATPSEVVGRFQLTAHATASFHEADDDAEV